MIALLLLAACRLSVEIPPGTLDEIARDTAKIAHPTASYEGAAITDLATGWFSEDRHVDVAIRYKGALGSKVRTLDVRFHVEDLDPCKVRTEVLGDSGKVPPLLLDNALAAPRVGQKVCAAFAGDS